MKYPGYKSNKNTGLSWVPTAPAHWEIKRLRFMLETINPTGAEIELADDADVSFIPMNAVGELGELDLSLTKPLNEIGSGYTYIREGDVVVAKITPCFENGKGAVAEGLTNGVAFGTTELHVLRSGPEMNNRFLFFLTASSLFRELGEGEMYGAGGQKRVPEDFIKDLLLPYPPLDEQHAIVAFLDEQTARLDSLITRQQCLLRLLAEKRMALITQAVTQGLDATVPLQPSGVDLHPNIVAHWEMKKATRVFKRIGSGTTPDSVELSYYDGNYLWVTTSELREKVIFDTKKKVTQLAIDEHSALKHYKAGAIVIAMYGATIGRLGILGVDATVNQACCVFDDPLEMYPKYFYYWLWMWRPVIISLSAGGGQPNLNQDMLRQLKVPVPPLNEQKAIAGFLDKELTSMEKSVAIAEKAIVKLHEYRAALITAAVTGQIDVRATVTVEVA